MKKFILFGVMLLQLIVGVSLHQAYATTSTSTCFGTDTVNIQHMDGSNNGTTFTDSSASAHTWTAHGSAVTDTAAQEFGTASAKFPGAGTDYISTGASSDFALGTGDFTIDFWAKFDSHANGEFWFNSGPDNNSNDLGVRYFTSHEIDMYLNNSTSSATWVYTADTGTWHHFAITRSGTSLKMFVDGTSLGTNTNSANVPNNGSLFIGATGFGGGPMTGHIDEFRIVKGTAVWTANFTSPTAAYTACTTRRRIFYTSVD